MRERAAQWPSFLGAGMPYYPSIATGWDATPRGAIFRSMRPKRYPWWPIVTGNTPGLFKEFLEMASAFSSRHSPVPLVMVASWNEWSEGHYLEPCDEWGFGWLKAILNIKRGTRDRA